MRPEEPLMALPLHLCAILLVATSVFGLAVSWLTATPYGLLAPVAALLLHARGRAVSLLIAALAIAFAGAVLATSLYEGGTRDLATSWAAFFAVALCIGVIAVTGVSASPGPEAVQAKRIIESMPGHAWSADPEGRFTYLSASTLAYVGQPVAGLGRSPDTNEFEWRRVVHPDDYERVVARWRHCLSTGDHYDTEHRIRRADGVYRWFRNSGLPSRDRQGRITGWYGTTIEIEDQKQAEAALRARERELSQLVEMVPSHLWRLSPDGEPIFFNKRMIDYLGLDVTDLDKPTMTRLEGLAETVHPDDAADFRKALGRCLSTGESFALRYRLRRSDGIHRWMSSRAEPLRDQAGRIAQWYGLCHDIDDEVRAQETLRHRERELSQLVNMVPVQIRRLTPEGEPTFFNKRLIDFFGLDIAELDKPGMSRLAAAIQTLVHPDDAAGLLETVRYSLATGEPYSMRYRMRRADGAYRWVDGRGEPLLDQSGAIVQWYAISIDIDDEMRAQQALRVRERELSQLVDMVPSLLWRLSPNGEPIFFNRRMVEFFGLDVGDYDKPGMSGLAAAIAALVHPEDAAKLREALNRSLATGESLSLNYRLRRADGAYRWMSARAEPLKDEGGRTLQWYGLCHDIDDQLRVEEALRERERFLWQLVETLPAMIDCAAPDGEPIYRSQQLREFLGYNLEELDGTGKSRLAGTLDAGVHPDDLAGVRENYANSLATGDPYARRHRLRRFDGGYRWVETRAAPMRDAEGAIVQWNVICLDIEGEVRAQEELRLAQENFARASQAASLAELSASIAHEVNQPLAAIVANSHACHRWLSAEPPNVARAKITAERITRDANSAADVVGRIRALFRRAPDARLHEDVNRLIREVCRLMSDEIAVKDVRIRTDLEPDLPTVALDRVQVQQVFLNLIRNGIEAMEAAADGARALEIRSCRDDLGGIRVEVRDAGSGFEDVERVFEPFFTTKQQGMGMGLAICRSIIESHGGRLWIANNEGRGATVAFTLPLAASTAP
jgi:PAS domain S-box-containing protein